MKRVVKCPCSFSLLALQMKTLFDVLFSYLIFFLSYAHIHKFVSFLFVSVLLSFSFVVSLSFSCSFSFSFSFAFPFFSIFILPPGGERQKNLTSPRFFGPFFFRRLHVTSFGRHTALLLSLRPRFSYLYAHFHLLIFIFVFIFHFQVAAALVAGGKAGELEPFTVLVVSFIASKLLYSHTFRQVVDDVQVN